MEKSTVTEPRFDLFKSILELSENKKSWEYACLEWELVRYRKSEEWDRCICGHRIKEVCIIKNTKNGNETPVGNCCIDKFPGQRKIMLALRAVRECRITEGLLKFLRENKVITKWEYEFMKDNLRKRKISEKQEVWLRRIRRKIFNALKLECPELPPGIEVIISE